MREAINTTDAPAAEQGWLDWLAAHGVPGITGVDTRALVRHIRRAGAMRGGIFPGSVSPGRRDGPRARRAVDGRARPRARGDAAGAAASRARAAGCGSSRSTPGSSDRSSASSSRAACSSSCTRARRRPDELLAARPGRLLPRARARRPGGARLPRRHDPRAARAQAGVRHLPRPPAAVAGGRPGDVQAAVRPPRRQPPGQGPRHRPDRDHLPEPRVRGGRRRPASGSSPTSGPPSSRT